MSYQAYPVWASQIVYGFGEIVRGTDLALYKAKSEHKSTAATRPITGASRSTYWVATTPSVARARKPNGTLEMPPMVGNDGRVSAPLTYNSLIEKAF